MSNISLAGKLFFSPLIFCSVVIMGCGGGGGSSSSPKESLPLISSLTDARVLTVGDDAVLEVVATGSKPLSYQWFHDDVLLVDEISSE